MEYEFIQKGVRGGRKERKSKGRAKVCVAFSSVFIFVFYKDASSLSICALEVQGFYLIFVVQKDIRVGTTTTFEQFQFLNEKPWRNLGSVRFCPVF